MTPRFKFTTLVGKFVWVRVASGDIYIGTLADKIGQEVALTDAHRLVFQGKWDNVGPLAYVELTGAVEVIRGEEYDKDLMKKLIDDLYKGKS